MPFISKNKGGATSKPPMPPPQSAKPKQAPDSPPPNFKPPPPPSRPPKSNQPPPPPPLPKSNQPPPPPPKPKKSPPVPPKSNQPPPPPPKPKKSPPVPPKSNQPPPPPPLPKPNQSSPISQNSRVSANVQEEITYADINFQASSGNVSPIATTSSSSTETIYTAVKPPVSPASSTERIAHMAAPNGDLYAQVNKNPNKRMGIEFNNFLVSHANFDNKVITPRPRTLSVAAHRSTLSPVPPPRDASLSPVPPPRDASLSPVPPPRDASLGIRRETSGEAQHRAITQDIIKSRLKNAVVKSPDDIKSIVDSVKRMLKD